MQPVIPQPSVLDLALILARRKWSLLAVTGVTLFSAIVWVFLIRDDLYEVSARVLVKIGREMAAPPSVMNGMQPVLADRKPDVNSEIDIIRSTELTAAVVDELRLDVPVPPPPPPDKFVLRARYFAKQYWRGFKDWSEELMISAGLRERLSPREKVIDALQRGIVVKPPKDSYVITVSLLLPSREGGGRILNKWLELYQTYRTQLYTERTAVPVFKKQTAEHAASLRDAERALQEFENEGGITAIEKQKEVLLNQVAAARTALQEAEVAHREAELKASRLEAEVRDPEPNFAVLGDFGSDSFVGRLLLQLAELQREREQLRFTELDTGAKIKNNRRQFNELMKLALSNVRSVLSEKAAIRDTRTREVADLQGRIDALHNQESEWNNLKRRTAVLEGSYLFYGKKLEEASANATFTEANTGNVVVAQKAMDALAPVGMRKTTVLGIALGLAILAALSWISVLEFFDRGVYTAAALENHLGIPVIASVPATKPRKILELPEKETGPGFRIYAAGNR